MAKAPLNLDLKLESKEWLKAMDAYVITSSRDFKTIADVKMKDIAIKAGKYTPRARVGHIRALVNEPWWPKLISKIIIRSYPRGTLTDGEFHQLAKEISKKLIAKRVRSATYLASGFFKAGKKFPDKDPTRQGKQKARKYKDFKNVKTTVQLATLKRALSKMEIKWGADSGGDAGDKEAIVRQALAAAIRQQKRDIIAHTRKKMRQAARKYSGKR